MATLTALATEHGARTGQTAKSAAHTSALEALAQHLQSAACDVLYAPYKTVQGAQELPVVVTENQSDQQRNAYADRLMTDLSKRAWDAARERDDATPQLVPLPERGCVHALKKWLVPRNLGTREDNKAVSQAVARALLSTYPAGAGLLRDMFDTAAERGLNQHDMADALLLAMQEALRQYAAHTKTVLSRRRRGEKRSDTPPLTPEQMSGGGTIRVVGIDPGERAMGLCVLELVRMEYTPTRSSARGDDPEPVFRVLLLQLVDLQSPWSPTQGHAVLHWSPAEPVPLLEPPGHGTTADVYKVATGVVEQTMAVRNKRKRKKPAVVAEAVPEVWPDDDPTPKRARREDAPMLYVDLVAFEQQMLREEGREDSIYEDSHV